MLAWFWLASMVLTLAAGSICFCSVYVPDFQQWWNRRFHTSARASQIDFFAFWITMISASIFLILTYDVFVALQVK